MSGGFPVLCYRTTLDVKRKARECENTGLVSRYSSVEATLSAHDYLTAMRRAGEVHRPKPGKTRGF
jgi:hypothetical protein